MGMAGPNPMGGPSGGPAMGLGPTPIGLPSQPAPSDPRISLQSVPARGLQPQQQMAVQDPRCNVMRLQKVHPLSARYNMGWSDGHL